MNCFTRLVFCFSLLSPPVLFAASQIDELIGSGNYDEAVQMSLLQPSPNLSAKYLGSIIKKARSLNLSNQSVWLSLGHYKKQLFGGQESQVDANDFFFSKKGKTSPAKELSATLAAFFSKRRLEPMKLSAQCRFIARFHWLNQQLQFDDRYLKKETCKDYQLFLQILVPEKLTVVFPATHPNSPSSMFGHTLLRVDKKGQTEQTKMLNYSINYAARVNPGTSSISYSVLGLSGGFPGKFSIIPYYSKLREYAQMENRDIWEYTLNISPKQIGFILMHTYELSPSYFDYYFFTENCSYHLLSLLDVSFSENRFTDQFKGWTIPVDTLRVLRERNLVEEIHYYPSHARIIRAKQGEMRKNDLALTGKAFTEGLDKHKSTIKMLSEQRQIQILDLLNDYYRFKKLKQSEHSATKLNQFEREVLLMRSKIKKPSVPPVVPVPSVKPDLGHNSSRISMGTSRLYGENDLSIYWRPAYHDLLDPSAGFSTNSSLEFMNVGLSYNLSHEKLRIKEVTVLEIVSLEPWTEFFSNYSWRLSSGWKNRPEVDVKNSSFIEAGGGLSYTISEKYNTLIYGFVGGGLQYGDGLSKNFRMAPDARLGLLSELLPGWRFHATLKTLQGIVGDTSQVNTIQFQQSFILSKKIALRMGAERGFKENVRWGAYHIELNYYF